MRSIKWAFENGESPAATNRDYKSTAVANPPITLFFSQLICVMRTGYNIETLTHVLMLRKGNHEVQFAELVDVVQQYPERHLRRVPAYR